MLRSPFSPPETRDESSLTTLRLRREPRPLAPEFAQLVADNRELREEVMTLRRLALLDELTGLHNRRYFEQRLTTELSRVERTGAELSLMLIDVDDFKRVNDRWGHGKGDEVLIWVGAFLTSQLRVVDIPCRLGGDEFGVLMPDTDEAGASLCAERLRRVLAQTGRKARHPVRLSFGTASTRGQRTEREVLLAEADSAMYRDKHARRRKLRG